MIKKLTYICLLIVLLVSSPIAFGQLQTERILIPVFAQGAPGAFGSVWQTELVGYNNSDQVVKVETVFGGCVLATDCLENKGPHETFRPPVSLSFPAGTFIYVSAATASPADLVSFDLRVRDMSHQAQTWGTAVPVIRGRQTYAGPLHLLSIPIDSRFRNSLRIYDFNRSQGRAVRLRIFPENGEALVDTLINLPPSIGLSNGQPESPSAVLIASLVDAFPQLATLHPDPTFPIPPEPRVRIEIDPVTAGLQFWACVSVTNDETQHVTMITPDPPPSQ